MKPRGEGYYRRGGEVEGRERGTKGPAADRLLHERDVSACQVDETVKPPDLRRSDVRLSSGGDTSGRAWWDVRRRRGLRGMRWRRVGRGEFVAHPLRNYREMRLHYRAWK